VARTASGERVIAVGLEQTAPLRAQVAVAAHRYALTPAEADTLALLARGLPNAAIAGRLRVEVSTVKTHVHRVIQKLGVASRVQAALLAHKPA
jgi:DNA-binding NarL/FixJ family response regulator